MTVNLWGENIPQKRSRKKQRPHFPKPAYSITGGNDCEIIGHTVNTFDLSGCSTCISCSVKIFCPRCIKTHPQDASAIAMLCERHEEPQESQVSA